MSEGRDDKGRFEPGHGFAKGRPKGARNKLGEAFLEALAADFEEHGVDTIQRVRKEDPVAYVKVCAGILPKELKISDERELTDEQLDQRIRQLAGLLDLAIEGGTRGAAEREEAETRH